MAMLFSSGCMTMSYNKDRAAYKEHLLRGQRYISSNKYDESVKEFTAALKMGKKINKSMVPLVMLGETHVRGNEIGEAAKIADEAVKRWPKESCAWELLGKVELKRNRLKDAEGSFEKALGLTKKKEDRKRISSLISLTKGLRAYAQANMQSTKKHFSEIKNVKLARDTKSKAMKILGVDVDK